MAGKASQSKGRRGELELSRLLQGYGYDGAPAVFFRRSRSPWLVVMKLEDWIRLYQKGGCDDELLGN